MKLRPLLPLAIFILGSLAPASARVSVLQVANFSDRCVTIAVYAAQDTESPMFQLPYQRAKNLKPGASEAFSAIKGRLPAMHLLVRAYIKRNKDCSGQIVGTAQADFRSIRVPLEVPTARVQNAGAGFRVVFP